MTTLQLDWTDNSSGAEQETNFRIERSQDGVSGWALVTDQVATDVTTYEDTNVLPSETWYYRVRAENTAGQSAWSNIDSGTVPGDPLTPTHYVSPSGDGSNGLTPATAFQNVTQVNAQTFSAGDVIAFEGGQTFTGTTLVPDTGAVGTPITYTSYGTGRATISTPGAGRCVNAINPNVTIDSINLYDHNGGGGAECISVVADNVIVRNCNLGNVTNTLGGRAATIENNATGWLFENCVFDDVPGPLVAILTGAGDGSFVNCQFNDNGKSTTGVQGEGILFNPDCGDNVTFDGCTFDMNPNLPEAENAIDCKNGTGHVAKNCTFLRAKDALCLIHREGTGTDFTFEYCIFDGTNHGSHLLKVGQNNKGNENSTVNCYRCTFIGGNTPTNHLITSADRTGTGGEAAPFGNFYACAFYVPSGGNVPEMVECRKNGTFVFENCSFVSEQGTNLRTTLWARSDMSIGGTITLDNCSFYANSSNDLLIDSDVADPFTTNNLHFDTPGVQNIVDINGTTYTEATVGTWSTGAQTGDPLFASTVPAHANFLLPDPGSPLLDNGLAPGPTGGDLRGTPWDTPPNIGCREGNAGAIGVVTSLADDGAGTLREALASGATYIQFDVGGTIKLESKIELQTIGTVIAGETAPSPGITIISAGFRIRKSNCWVRHLRFRPGDEDPGAVPANNRDGIEIFPLDGDIENVVISNCSVAWAIDESISIFAAKSLEHRIRNCVIIDCLVGEALSNSIHPDGEHSKGIMLAGGGDQDRENVGAPNLMGPNAMIRCLSVCCRTRNPWMNDGCAGYMLNNWSHHGELQDWNFFSSTSASSPYPVYAAVINDQATESSEENQNSNKGMWSATTAVGSEIYVSGTVGTNDTGTKDESYQADVLVSGFDPRVGSVPAECVIDWSVLPINEPTTLSLVDARNYIVANVGAYPSDRDATDTRQVNLAVNGLGILRDSLFEEPLKTEAEAMGFTHTDLGPIEDLVTDESNIGDQSLTTAFTASAGANRKLFVTITTKPPTAEDPTIATVTYAGNALTQDVNVSFDDGGGAANTSVWRLDNPESFAASGDIVITMTGAPSSGRIYMGAYTVDGLTAGGPVDTATASQRGNSTPDDIDVDITPSIGDFVLSVLGYDATVDWNPTPPTTRYVKAGVTGGNVYSGTYDATAGGLQNIEWVASSGVSGRITLVAAVYTKV